MNLLIFHIVVNGVMLALGSAVLGLALRPFFEDLGVKKWRAVLPFYNVIAWLAVFRLPRWLVVPFFMSFWLPTWWAYAISGFVAALLVFKTLRLYRKALHPYYAAVGAGVLLAVMSSVGAADRNTFGIILAFTLFSVLMTVRRYAVDRSKLFENKHSFASRSMSRFKRHRSARWASGVLLLLIFVAMHAPYIANDQPLIVKYKGMTIFPAWVSIVEPTRTISIVGSNGETEKMQMDIVDWHNLNAEIKAWAVIRFDDKFQDKDNRGFADPSDLHPMGTDQVGRDVAAGLIYGARYSLLIGIIAMGIAGLIGIIFGGVAGYFGDRRWKLSGYQVVGGLFGLFLGTFYAFVNGQMPVWGMPLTFIGIPAVLVWLTGRIEKGRLAKPVSIPLDAFLLRLMEVLNSVPRLLLIIVIAAVVNEPSIWLVMIVIGLTAWTGVARFTRAEMFKIRSMNYIESARALGYTDGEIIFKHALPNAIAPVLVALAFGIAGSILIESGLSFLGIGVPQDIVTWGSLLNAGRQSFDSWWLIVFPGAAIFLTIICFNLIGDGVRDALDK